ncbi:MAG: acetylxylan esterase [Clostridia bacterium]|nr:acetylxylan esterase [Clostridia bacterium]
MRTILKSSLSLVLALMMVISLVSIPVFAADLTSITELDISKCQKIYFKGETNKDFTKYEVGEEMVFTMTLYADNAQISAPYFKYTITGDDGYSTSGYADATSGTVVLKAKATKVGGVRVVVEPADADKKVISDTKITKFEGGAIAGAADVKTTYAEPLDFDEFWAGKLAELDECAPNLFSIEQIDSSNSNFDTYIVKVNCIGRPEMIATNATWTAGILTVPKNAAAGSLGFRLTFQGYGVSSAGRSNNNGYVTFAVCAHSMEQLQPSEYYNKATLGLNDYGFKVNENVDPNTSYFTYMLLRDVQAVRFLKKYFGTEGGEATFGGVNTGAWKGLWNGQDIYVSGGSQGGFQSVGVAALDSDVTYVNVNVPWFADVAGNTVSTRIQSTFRPTYADGLRYLDTALLAKRIKAPKVDITAGAGDPLCTMYAVQAIYNNLNVDNASLRFRQGGTHSSTNTYPIDFTQKKTKDSVSVPTDAFVGSGFDSETFKDAWFALTGRNAVIVESALDFSASHAKKVYIDIADFAGVTDGGKSYDELYNEYSAKADEVGADVYAIGYTGEISAPNNAHKASLKLATEAESDIYLVAFGENAESEKALAEAVATNLAGAIFGDQPMKDIDYRLVSENGVVSSMIALANDLNDVEVYPVTAPCYAMKNAGISTIYKSPAETGTENGSVTLLAGGVSKTFDVLEASEIDAFGEDAGVEFLLKNGILNIYGDDIAEDAEYAWNAYMSSVSEVVLSDGIKSIPANAFDMPEDSKITVPFSVENISDDAFCGKTDFTIVSYDASAAQSFAEANGLTFESLGVRYITGNVIAYYQNSVMANNLWKFDTSTKVLTITSNKSGYNESGAQDSKEGNWQSILKEIEEVVLVGNIAKITGKAFNGATNLRKVTMPALAQIDSGAFYGCVNLETICVTGRPCIEGVLDFGSITGSNEIGSSSFAKADVFNTTVKANGIVLGSKFSETAPLVLGNLPNNIGKIYGSTDYLAGFCEENGVEFVPFGRSSDNAFSWTIEDSTLTLYGEGILNNLGAEIDKFASKVKKVIIPKNVVEIADDALAALTKLNSAVFEGNAPRVANGAKPFGEQGSHFVICPAEGVEGFEADTWCGYAVYNATYVSGDINDDGEITVADAVLLAQYLAGWEVEINADAADCNGDGEITVADAVLLAQYLAGWEVDLVGPSAPVIPDDPDPDPDPNPDPDPDPDPDPEESEDNEVEEDDLLGDNY